MTVLDWLRLLGMIFYAPVRGLREVRDRASLAPAALVALLAHIVFFYCLTVLYLGFVSSPRNPSTFFFVLIQSGSSLVIIALVFCPLALFLSNIFVRRGSFRLLLQQEYASFAATMFYALAASSLIATLLTITASLSGVQQALASRMLGALLAQREKLGPEFLALIEQGVVRAEMLAAVQSIMAFLAIFGIWAIIAVRTVFRLSWIQSSIVVLVSGTLLIPASRLIPIAGMILASPFLLVMVFLLLRGYISEITRTQRSRESFKQNLEAATLNPADASAHYNLGLIHQQRGELEAARERFERAIQIDADEIDAHYQLGRIARSQKQFADAIKHFEQVVARDATHSQHEIWREVGATYNSAGQHEDARDALERFLDHRPSDPEALYLMGRAHAGMGHQREAASSMQACIEAVKTAPAYKYRADKRWLNEAQQFIKSSQ
ncbi:MAG TPA: tetratricopeptide repeat protein [Pyrinomonadaceae bacterium]|nr:tetratricopeptide repeat protein [Pyrinomonadaceae bacterium]